MTAKKADKSVSRRYRRAAFTRETRLIFGENTDVWGVSNDISPNSLSLFIPAKEVLKYLKNKGFNVESVDDILGFRKGLKDEKVMLAFQDPELSSPLTFRIQRIEASWQKGFDLFIAGGLENLDEFHRKSIEEICPLLKTDEKKKRYVSKELPDFKNQLISEGGSCFQMEFANYFDHISICRDTITLLAEKAGFREEDAYIIKLMSDEVLMNAFLYGSVHPGKDKTRIKVLTSESGILVEVQDFAGRVFDEYPYHFRKNLSTEQLGGLSLVEAYSDDWQVDFVPGQQTVLTFFKSLANGK